MTYLICPGIHDPQLTNNFLEALKQQRINLTPLLVLPVDRYPTFSAFHIVDFLQQEYKNNPFKQLTFISFSAGVVGAIGAAWRWRQQGKQVRALIAVDGWGVPLWGDFPIYRLSHDSFTHWSSALLGEGQESFYADPPVEHLDLWRAPQAATGWQIRKNHRSWTTASSFLGRLLSS
ncbi:hypothetical protein [Gloeothece verrucosa]|uniref:Alpha/beta hydrolase n=1 Tax=Gloeothece verrucosa (strain PCC 7822) TaxID=497965 RepID=E0UE95_GLOV7|nr:hypothetical protein [Gloeothece verrucosa]ADN14220.1 conserved hypothetical protein [Gloeothece verrucosa PCC 7822]